MGYRILVFIFLSIVWSLTIKAQDYQYKIKHFNVDQGLAHTDATAIAQDDNGFIWIGTYGGLNKYDGYIFQLFRNNEDNLAGTYTNRIVDLSFDNEYLFIASQGGLLCFNTITEKYVQIKYDEPEYLKLKNINKILTVSNKLYCVTNNAIEIYDYKIKKNGIQLSRAPHKHKKKLTINDLVKDLQGKVWITADTGLYFTDPTLKQAQVYPVTVLNQLRDTLTSFNAIHVDNERKLWLTGGGGALTSLDLYSLSDNQVNGYSYTEFGSKIRKGFGLENSALVNMNSITSTIDNRLWIGTDNGLVSISENNGVEYSFYHHTNNISREQISTKRINSLFTDSKGNLWASTYGGGVNFIDVNQKKFHLITVNPNDATNTLPSKFVRAVIEDEKGNIWIGTEREGLVYYNFRRNKFTYYKHDEKLSNTILDNNIRSLEFDSEGNLWIGSINGITILNPETKTAEYLTHDPKNPNSLSANSIFDISRDKFGNMWAGSWISGLNHITKKNGAYQIERFNEQKDSTRLGLTSEVVSYIYTDEIYPEIFVSTTNGLNHIFLDFKGRVFKIDHYIGNEVDNTSLSSNFIWPVERLNDSILWAGTIGGGLNRMRLTTTEEKGYVAQSYKSGKGAPSADVESLIIDDDNHLWAAGNGLTKLNVNTEKFINFSVNDGLQGNSFKIGAAHKGKSGRLYFGGTEGITYFFPREIVADTILSEVVLTSFSINNEKLEVGVEMEDKVILSKDINYLKNVLLDYEDNNFTISFSSLDFSNPEGSRYRYMLEGFDTDWIEIDGKYPVATYANLDHKDYVFKVTSANNSGIWSNKMKTLYIEITPPWWATVTAKIIYILIVISFLYFVFRWVLLKRQYDISILEKNQEEEINQLRLQFFTNISHEFRTPLTLIVNPLQELLKGNLGKRKRQRYYSHMLSNSKRMLRLINELMDFQKIETKEYSIQLDLQDIENVIKEVNQSFVEFAFSKEIDFSYLPRTKVQEFLFDRTVIEKILYNVLGNAFKYTEKEGTITVELLDKLNDTSISQKKSVKIGEIDHKGDFIYIRISDTGKGISENDISFIFDRFFHKDYSYSNGQKTEGSGVGLSLVKSLVTLHNGAIIVSSEENVGTTLTIAIPYLLNAEGLPERNNTRMQLSKSSLSPLYDKPIIGPDLGVQFGKPTILVVEDNHELRYFIKENLEDEFVVLEAENGVEAMDILDNKIVALILSDISMPKMGGLELCENVKNSEKYRSIPFLLLTSNVTIEKQLEGAYAKADLFISKPFSIEVLKVNVQNIIFNRQSLKKNIIEDTFTQAHGLSEHNKDNHFIQSVLSIIAKNIEDVDFDVSVLADKMNISRTNLYNKMKALTEKPTGTLIREIRVRKAAELLASQDVSVAQAMYKVGIQSQSYFTKIFKKEYGKTPSQFVKEMSNKNQQEND